MKRGGPSTQVSASSVLDFLGTVFGAAAAPPKDGYCMSHFVVNYVNV